MGGLSHVAANPRRFRSRLPCEQLEGANLLRVHLHQNPVALRASEFPPSPKGMGLGILSFAAASVFCVLECNGIRSRDLQHIKLTLYQLSYTKSTETCLRSSFMNLSVHKILDTSCLFTLPGYFNVLHGTEPFSPIPYEMLPALACEARTARTTG